MPDSLSAATRPFPLSYSLRSDKPPAGKFTRSPGSPHRPGRPFRFGVFEACLLDRGRASGAARGAAGGRRVEDDLHQDSVDCAHADPEAARTRADGRRAQRQGVRRAGVRVSVRRGRSPPSLAVPGPEGAAPGRLGVHRAYAVAWTRTGPRTRLESVVWGCWRRVPEFRRFLMYSD